MHLEAEPSLTVKPVTLAIFDVDGTLIKGDSLLLFGKFLLRRRAPRWSEVPRFMSRLAGYAMHLADAGEVKASLLKMLASGLSAAEMASLVDVFARNVLVPRLYPQAAERIRWHQRQGHRAVFLSASPAIYLEGFARALEVDSMIGTRLRWRDGIFCGDLDGENCKGQEKLVRLMAHYEGEVVDWAASYYYADSSSDIPVFEKVGQPVVVNPGRKLERAGARRRWRIEQWSQR